MCLALPGRILSVDCSLPNMKMALVDFGGVKKNICIEWVEAKVEDYILAHAGMAIAVVNQQEAEETLMDLEKLARAHDR